MCDSFADQFPIMSPDAPIDIQKRLPEGILFYN